MKQPIPIALAIFAISLGSCLKSTQTNSPDSQTNLTLETDTVILSSGDHDTMLVALKSAVYWTVSIPDSAKSWLKASPANGSGSQTITFVTLSANTSDSDRIAEVTITPISATLPVTHLVVIQISKNSEALANFARTSFGGRVDDVIYSVIEMPDHNWLCVGTTSSHDADLADLGHGFLYDVWVFKMNRKGELLWSKSLGGSGQEEGFRVIPSNDGNYMILAMSGSQDGDVARNHGLHDIWIVKIDPTGGIIWEHSYGGSGEDIPGDIISATGGGYVVAANSQSGDGDLPVPGRNAKRLWMFNIDETGNLRWQLNFGGNAPDKLNRVIRTPSGSYLFAGYTESMDGDLSERTFEERDGLLIDVSPTGQLIKHTLIHGLGQESVEALLNAPDGGYYLGLNSNSSDAMWSNANDPVTQDVWLLKLTSSLAFDWIKNYGGTGNDNVADLRLLDNGDLLMVGKTESHDKDAQGNHGGVDAFVARVSGTGDFKWWTNLGGSDYDEADAVLAFKNGQYLMAGWSKSTDGDVVGAHANDGNGFMTVFSHQ